MGLELRPEQEKITEIFLSATAKDCYAYRVGVKDAVTNRVRGTQVHLQEHWNYGWQDVVRLCLEKLAESHAYFGVFGFRYGWMPDGHDKSITELEFDAACAKWLPSSALEPQTEASIAVDPPMFIFLPAEGSEAADDLSTRAHEALDKEYQQDLLGRERSCNRQDLFRRRLLNSGRFCNRFRTLGELREQAITCVLTYNLCAVERGRQSGAPSSSRIPDDALGAIGRRLQLHALEESLAEFRVQHPEAPAFCAIMHGLENWGQWQFASFLAHWDLWETENRPPFLPRIADPDDERRLLAEMLRCLEGVSAGPPTVEMLAEAVLRACARENVVFIINDLGRRDDRLTAFHRRVWLPLQAALRRGWQTPPKKKGRFMMVVADHRRLTERDAPLLWRREIDGGDPDYRRLLPLPELTPIAKAEVEDWLKALFQHGWKKLTQARRWEIAERVTHTRDHQPDGTPLNVYDRLEHEEFWSTRD